VLLLDNKRGAAESGAAPHVGGGLLVVRIARNPAGKIK